MQPSNERPLLLRTNYILIDYENVQVKSLDRLQNEQFKVLIFLGPTNTKLPVDLVLSVQRLGDRAQYILLEAPGPNALDFHLAYYMGVLSSSDPTAYFHIISKDTGFDPLIAHLKAKKIFACRSRAIADMPIVKAANSKSQPEKLAVILANLQQRGAAKPRTVKTLSSTIGSLFQKTLTEDEIASLLKIMQDKGYITLNATKVAYSLPS